MQGVIRTIDDDELIIELVSGGYAVVKADRASGRGRMPMRPGMSVTFLPGAIIRRMSRSEARELELDGPDDESSSSSDAPRPGPVTRALKRAREEEGDDDDAEDDARQAPDIRPRPVVPPVPAAAERRGPETRYRVRQRLAASPVSRGGISLSTTAMNCPFRAARREDRFVYPGFTRETNEDWATPWGIVGLRYSRYAPYIQTSQDHWGTTLKTDYAAYITALRESALSDPEIALRFLSELPHAFAGRPAQAAAALHATVNVAEEWRKKGAAKIFRALLWTVLIDKISLEEAFQRFDFIPSAQEGMEQVGRFDDHANNNAPLPQEDRRTYDLLSVAEDDEWSSDDEDRAHKDSDRKTTRLHAQRHQSSSSSGSEGDNKGKKRERK